MRVSACRCACRVRVLAHVRESACGCVCEVRVLAMCVSVWPVVRLDLSIIVFVEPQTNR